MHLPSCASWALRRAPILLAFLLLTCGSWHSTSADTFGSVGDLKAAMYSRQDSRGCYKLLNSTGVIGCEAPDGDVVTAVLLHLDDRASQPAEDIILVVPANKLTELLIELRQNGSLGSKVKGVLVENADSLINPPQLSSGADPFPSAAYSLYNTSSYSWNPAGSGINRVWFGLPIFQMTEKMSNSTVQRARYNAEQSFKGSLHFADLDLKMEAAHNSTHCLALPYLACQPLSGFSVWAGLPAMSADTIIAARTGVGRPITLVTAQVDSDGLFHELVQAADTPISGLIAMMVAARILALADRTDSYRRQLVFAALQGEPWDFMGSKRFLLEMDRGSITTAGLNITLIEQVVEVGPVGHAFRPASNSTGLYLHAERGASFGSTSALTAAFTVAANVSASGPALDGLKVDLSAADVTTPGLPPASLSSFLRVKPSIQGIYLAEFDKEYINRYTASSYDTQDQIDLQPVIATAILLARALDALALNGTTLPSLEINTTDVALQVAILTSCLAMDEPGLGCDLASTFFNPGYEIVNGVFSRKPHHYISVMNQVTDDPQDPSFKPDMTRFIWSYLANATAEGPGTGRCDPVVNKCSEGLVCLGWKFGSKDQAGLGACVNASVHYVLAASTKVEFSSKYGIWVPSNASFAFEAAYGWPPDPMWSESNWPLDTLIAKVYQRESTRMRVAVLVIGLGLTAVVGLASFLGMRAFEERLKQQ